MKNALDGIWQTAKYTAKIVVFAWNESKILTFLYFGTTILAAFATFLVSLSMSALINTLNEALANPAAGLGSAVFGLLFMRYAFDYVDGIMYWNLNENYIDYLLRNRMQNAVNIAYHTKIVSLDIGYFENPKTQDMLTRVRENMKWKMVDCLRFLRYMVYYFTMFVAAGISLYFFGWWIPVVIFAVAIPKLLLRSKYGSRQWSMWGAGAPGSRKLWYMDYLLYQPTAIREMRVSQTAQVLIKKFSKLQNDLFELIKKPLDQYMWVVIPFNFVDLFILIGISALFVPSVLSGAMSVGAFTFFLSQLEQFLTRSGLIATQFGTLYENSLVSKDFFGVLSLPKIVPEATHPTSIDTTKPPHIEFKNVSFSYPGSISVLKNISFSIPAGKSIALVGQNGAGKSTIIKLLCRFYDPTEGEIRINGIDLKNISQKEWYACIGTLFQDYIQYHFSVRENITLGAPDKLDDKLMHEAARKSGAAEFIETFPNKYDQILGREYEEGTELSGGQWQKIAIARAFYEEPPILILDEPTSAIDAAAEMKIFENLELEYAHKSLILVSHRFSTVRKAEEILVIEKGEIIERGNHETLLKKKGMYARLFNAQAKGYS